MFNYLCDAEHSGSWVDLSLPAWRSALRCWWCPTTGGFCSAVDTGTAVCVSPSWARASWWAGSAGTLVSWYCYKIRAKLLLNFRYLSSCFCVPQRCCYLLGSGSLWHLPHLWFKGHILYRVAGSTAGKRLQIFLFLACRHVHTSCRHSWNFKWTRLVLSFRVASPAACLLGRCRFSVDMTRRSPA